MFKGSIPALVTPMRGDGAIDFDAWDRLLDFHLAEGTDGVVVGGTTGESPTLERGRARGTGAARQGAASAGRMPVIAGSGTNGTAKSVALSKAAEAAGADALLVVTPYYNRPTQEGLFRHFTAIADAVGDPDHPLQRAGPDGLRHAAGDDRAAVAPSAHRRQSRRRRATSRAAEAILRRRAAGFPAAERRRPDGRRLMRRGRAAA